MESGGSGLQMLWLFIGVMVILLIAGLIVYKKGQ
jgi:hypothetical protein